MKFFHESENKYYEVISILLNGKSSYCREEIDEKIKQVIEGERDFEVEDILFSKKEETIFKYTKAEYKPIIAAKFPVRNNQIELQAIKTLKDNNYVKYFLEASTMKKLKGIATNIEALWDIEGIDVKNQFCKEKDNLQRNQEKKLNIIAKAILQHKSIVYDNILYSEIAGLKYKYINAEVFPIRIEYSLMNDVFRICTYDTEQKRFIKMNFATMKNIQMGSSVNETLESKYEEFLLENMKKVILEIDPVPHIIERCFRIFSSYDRKAIFEQKENKYLLEISYLKFDEMEVIRDILSMGSYAIVIEPKKLQKEIYRRIIKSRDNYL